jgi:GxxExxY protein
MKFELLSELEEEIGSAIIRCAYKVHKELGPGLLEKVYEICLAHELTKLGYAVERQIDIPIKYDGLTFKEGLRLDIMIEKRVIVEVKAVDEVNSVWVAQVLSHLKLTGLRLGYLLNFGDQTIKSGARRIIL